MEINHRKDYSTLAVHEDFVFICKGDTCKALILSVIEKLINEQQSLFVPISFPDFIHEMYGIYRRNRISEGLQALMDEGLVERNQMVNSHYVFEYTINTPLIQEMIDDLPDKTKLKHVSASLNDLLKDFEYLCAYCQKHSPTSWDHVIPRSKQGSRSTVNIVPSCRVCNVSKSDKDVLIWMKSLSYIPSKALLRKFKALGIEVQQ